jgi:hypothetical protein
MVRFASIVLFVLFFAVSSEIVQGQSNSPAVSGWVETEGQSKGSDQKAQVGTLINFAGNDKVGAYIWAQSGPGYSQVYGGPTVSPKPWLQVGGALGVERSGHNTSLRVGGFVWLGKNRVSNITLIEGGGSGFWYKNQTSLKISKGITTSLINQRFAGTGPELEIPIPKTKLSVRASVLGQDGGPTVKVAIRLNF